MSKLKIAVVGPGLIGRKHIELILRHGECQLAAIVAPQTSENLKVAKAAGVDLYSDLPSLFCQVHVDGVIISSPNLFHVDQASQCINNHIPVLVEKPVAHSFKDGATLMKLVERKKGRLLVGHHRTYSSIIMAARKLIESGQLGTIVAIMGSALFFKPDRYFEDGPWRAEEGGGPILINLIHEVGNFRALCGEISSVHAMTSNNIRNYPVEDTAAINLRFKSGVLGTFLMSDTVSSANSWEQTSGENPIYPQYKDADCYIVSGTAGTLAIPSMQVKFFHPDQEKSWLNSLNEAKIIFQRNDPLEAQLDHFINVIKGFEEPRVTIFDGLQNLKVVDAICLSAMLRKEVSV